MALLANFNYLLMKLTGNTTIAVIGRVLSEVVELHKGTMPREWRDDGAGFPRSYSAAAIRGCKKLVDLIEAGDRVAAESFWARQLDRAYGQAAQTDNADDLLDLLGRPASVPRVRG
jgi:hypothetical protein